MLLGEYKPVFRLKKAYKKRNLGNVYTWETLSTYAWSTFVMSRADAHEGLHVISLCKFLFTYLFYLFIYLFIYQGLPRQFNVTCSTQIKINNIYNDMTGCALQLSPTTATLN